VRFDKTSAIALHEVGKTNVWLRVGNQSGESVDKGKQPVLGLLSKAAGGDRPPFIALTHGSGTPRCRLGHASFCVHWGGIPPIFTRSPVCWFKEFINTRPSAGLS